MVPEFVSPKRCLSLFRRNAAIFAPRSADLARPLNFVAHFGFVLLGHARGVSSCLTGRRAQSDRSKIGTQFRALHFTANTVTAQEHLLSMHGIGLRAASPPI
jgi:hypothetical protein